MPGGGNEHLDRRRRGWQLDDWRELVEVGAAEFE
jgi:hypothetical protein